MDHRLFWLEVFEEAGSKMKERTTIIEPNRNDFSKKLKALTSKYH